VAHYAELNRGKASIIDGGMDKEKWRRLAHILASFKSSFREEPGALTGVPALPFPAFKRVLPPES